MYDIITIFFLSPHCLFSWTLNDAAAATTDTFDTADEKDVSLHQIDNFYDSVMEVATELSVPHHERHGPYFDVSASKNVTALVGKTAQLNCRVHNLGNKTLRMPPACHY
uniref:Uncharacterized protein n=1 Tax=Phlebotomus papatasi TaxID=29031 RepID=A0A1B0D6A4_PHLPP